MTVQDFYPTKELPNRELALHRCRDAEVDIHADGEGNVIVGFVNVVTAYQGPFAQHRDFVRTFPVDLVLVICEVQHEGS